MTNRPPERLRLDRLATPIGEALLVTDEAGYLRALDWADCEPRVARLLRLHYGSVVPEPAAAPSHIKRLLRSYFDGELESLAAIAPCGLLSPRSRLARPSVTAPWR